MLKQSKKLKGLKGFRLTIQLLLVVAVLLPIFSPSIVFADEVNSNDRRMGVINLGKGKQNGTNPDDLLTSLTGDQLKTIGVFMSNYYVPFSTQIGSGRSEKEEEDIKKQMVEALTKTGSFTEEVATSVVGAVLEVSKNPKPLYFAYSTDGGKNYKSASTNGKKGRQATFYEFLDQVSGYAYKGIDDSGTFKPYPDKETYEKAKKNTGTDSAYSIYRDENYGYTSGHNLNRGALFWDDANGKASNTSRIVFDWNPAKSEGGGQTASQTVMAQIYKYLDAENSVGTAFLDYTNDERGGDVTSNSITKLVEKTKMQNGTIEKLYKRSMYDWTMWVDAFGNILVDTGVRQYVVVPAAMNPYTFKKTGTDSDGKEFEYGRSVPVNNLISITLASQNKLLAEDTKPTQNVATLNVGGIYSKFPDDKEGDQKALYKFPGSGDVDWAEGKGFDWGSSLLESLTSQYGVKKYGVPKKDDQLNKDWFSLKGAPNKVERYTSASDNLYKMFQYGFNSTSQNYAVLAPRSGLNSKPKHYVIQDLVAFDTFGALTNKTYVEEEVSEESLKRARIWDDNGVPAIKTDGITDGSAFGEKLAPERNKLNTASNQVMKDYSSNLYVTYVLAGLGGQEKVGFSIGFEKYPTYDGSTVLDGELDSEDQLAKNTQEVMNMAYFFLHPTEAPEYFARWAKTKISAVLVGWHNDMTGANNSENSSGMTKYIGFSGFTTMPSLNDMEWTNWMVNSYLSWGIYLIIAVVVIMIFYIALGEVSIQRAILGILIFSVCLYLPPTAINSTVGLTNTISDAIYSNKFLYWGIMQLQTYAGKVDQLAEQGKDGDEVNYSQTLLSIQNGSDGLYSNNSSLGNGVTLKWMAPKKDNYLEQIQNELNASTGGQAEALADLTDGLLRKNLSGESYVDSSSALYLYRTFSDITNYSRFLYGNTMGDNIFGNGSLSHDISDISESLSTVGMGKVYQKYLVGKDVFSLYDRTQKGFVNDFSGAIDGSATKKSRTKRIYAPLSSQTVAQSSNVNIDKLQVGDKVGVSNDYFKATIKNFNNHEKLLADQLSTDISSAELASTSSFALYTESPYYYFSWFLYDNGMSTQSGSTDSFRKLMLAENDEFFYNYKISKDSTGYGALKDYFDMGSLFTTVIPYLRQVNAPLEQWSNVYGTEPYLDVSVKETDADMYQDKNSDSYYKYWYNVNLARLYNTYSPWVDAMYDSAYAKPEKISYGGKDQIVEDPINPASYTVRPMVFSESEKEYYGLKDYNLTEVERKILKVQKSTREDLLQLLNYYSFDDTVLNSTAAMIMTFNFNKEFSQNNFLSESFVQYPQGFELKNFTYDAYLRLILSNATGEDLKSTDGMITLYERIVENSSIFTGILLVLGDVLAVYVIPVMKFIFLILVFVLSVLTIFVKAMRVEVSFIKVIWDSLAKPLLMFCSVTLGHSLLVSFFMTNGATDITGETSINISLEDPSMTLIVLMLINAVAIVLYALITWGLIKDLITYGKLSYNVVGGVLSSSLSFAGSKLSGVSDTVQGHLGGYKGSKTPSSSSYTSNPEDRGRSNLNPELTVESELRTRDINTRAYADELNVKERKDNLDLESTIAKGKAKVMADDVIPSAPKSEEPTDRFPKDEIEQRERDINKLNSKEDIKKHAEEVKNKYNLD